MKPKASNWTESRREYADGTADFGRAVQAFHRLHQLWRVKEGAEVLTGGKKASDGYFVQPTAITKTKPEMKAAREEIFGSVVCASPITNAALMTRPAGLTLVSGHATSRRPIS
jgi:acyl-CoA reductase-like NAD-dependent aldehyde dehydrogenase